MVPTIIAMGGGGFMMEITPLLDDHVLAAARARAAHARPRVLFVPTASGDSPDLTERFYDAVGPRCDPSHLELFNQGHADLRGFVLGHDAIYVGGGNTANMLAVWRVHGIDRILREAHEAGIVLAGLSAGAVCWFEGGITDSYGPALAILRDGVGLVPGPMVPHYDSEAARRPALHRAVADGTFASAWAADDGAALVFQRGTYVEAVASRPRAAVYRVTRGAGGAVEEARIPARYLG